MGKICKQLTVLLVSSIFLSHCVGAGDGADGGLLDLLSKESEYEVFELQLEASKLTLYPGNNNSINLSAYKKLPDGSSVDVSQECDFVIENPKVIAHLFGGRIVPLDTGESALTATYKGRESNQVLISVIPEDFSLILNSERSNMEWLQDTSQLLVYQRMASGILMDVTDQADFEIIAIDSFNGNDIVKINDKGLMETTDEFVGSFQLTARFLDKSSNNLRLSVSDTISPLISKIETMDNNQNGLLDSLKISFSEPIDDNSFLQNLQSASLSGLNSLAQKSAMENDFANDDIFYVEFPEQASLTNDATPTLILNAIEGGFFKDTHNRAYTGPLELWTIDKATSNFVEARGYESNNYVILQFDGPVYANQQKGCNEISANLTYNGNLSFTSYLRGCGTSTIYWNLDDNLLSSNNADNITYESGLFDAAGNLVYPVVNRSLKLIPVTNVPKLRRITPPITTENAAYYTISIEAGTRAGQELFIEKGTKNSFFYNPLNDSIELGPLLPVNSDIVNSKAIGLSNGDILLVHLGNTTDVSLLKATNYIWEAAAPLPAAATDGYLVNDNGTTKLINQYGILEWTDPSWLGSNVRWAGRQRARATIHQGKIFLSGGKSDIYHNDVWSTTDGFTWEEVEKTAGWSPRYGHSLNSLNDKLIIVGGLTEAGNYSGEVWESVDGSNWTKLPDAPFTGRYNHASIVFNGKLYILGGRDSNFDNKNDIWETENGTDWFLVSTAGATWTGRYGHVVSQHNGAVYLTGGYGSSPSYKNDTWSSTDLSSWTLLEEGSYSGRREHQMISHNDKLHILGGREASDFINDPNKNDTYTYQTDRWTLTNENNAWETRYGHQVLNYGNTIYLLGGPNKSDVWRSTDAQNWNKLELNTSSSWAILKDGLLYRADSDSLISINTNNFNSGPSHVLPTAPGSNSQLWQYESGYIYSLGNSKQLFTVSDDLSVTQSLPDLPIEVGNNASLFEIKAGVNRGKWLLWNNHKRYLGNLFSGEWESLDEIPIIIAGKDDGVTSEPSKLSEVLDSDGYRVITSGGKAHIWDGQKALPGSVTGQFGKGSQFIPMQQKTLITEAKTSLGSQDSESTGGIFYDNKTLVAANDFPFNGTGSFYIPFSFSEVFVHNGNNKDVPEFIMINSGTPDFDNTLGLNLLDAHQLMLNNNANHWYLYGNSARIFSKAEKNIDGYAGWEMRNRYEFVNYNGELYLIGGRKGGSASTNDVWKTKNGRTWELVTDNAPWGPRDWFRTVVFDGKIFLIGGGGEMNDVWTSTNGKDWTNILPADIDNNDCSSNLRWCGRYDFAATVFNGAIYLFGGRVANYLQVNDAWRSVDGINWTKISPPSGNPWESRYGFEAVTFKDKVYIFGGYARYLSSSSRKRNDVWSSIDGINWQQSFADWSGRYRFGTTVHNDKIYVMGGLASSRMNDVWSSSDGEDWQQETSSADWDDREYFDAMSYNGKLYVAGGRKSSTDYKDVWSSIDGNNWEKLGIFEALPLPCSLGAGSHYTTIKGGEYDSKILIFCGGGKKSTIMFNPVDQSFSAGPLLSSAISNQAQSMWLTKGANAGKLLILAGSGYKDLQLYDPASNSFSITESFTDYLRDGTFMVEITKGDNQGKVIIYAGGGTGEAYIYTP